MIRYRCQNGDPTLILLPTPLECWWHCNVMLIVSGRNVYSSIYNIRSSTTTTSPHRKRTTPATLTNWHLLGTQYRLTYVRPFHSFFLSYTSQLPVLHSCSSLLSNKIRLAYDTGADSTGAAGKCPGTMQRQPGEGQNYHFAAGTTDTISTLLSYTKTVKIVAIESDYASKNSPKSFCCRGSVPDDARTVYPDS